MLNFATRSFQTVQFKIRSSSALGLLDAVLTPFTRRYRNRLCVITHNHYRYVRVAQGTGTRWCGNAALNVLNHNKAPYNNRAQSFAAFTSTGVFAGLDNSSTTMPATERRELYPEIEPFNSGMLKVSDLHSVYYEQCGKKDGKPVLYMHGGPGGGISAQDRRYFDPNIYHIILMDQRGAGKSTPPAELRENTTWDIVADMEKLRAHLGVDRWVVFGGSWGSCISLTYAETHPDRVTALIIRGIFTLRRSELLWYYQDGASHIFPDEWEKYLEPIPKVERGDLMSAYHRRLTGDNEQERLKCARAWSGWEMATSRLFVDEEMKKRTDSDQWALQFARIECHYFVHGGFFRQDDQVLADVEKIRHIPCTIVQGRYDVVCPATTAWELHKRFPEAEFHFVPDAGHSAKEEGTRTLLLNATDKYAQL